MKQALLVGNPNCGKSTLFNALTNGQERIGNWPGVTVEKKSGICDFLDQEIEIIDLPGVYSLVVSEKETAHDAQITANVVASSAADCIINVIDACHLERHLYLTSQLFELGKPIIVVLNMMDIARQRGINININALSKSLGCKVLALEAHRQVGVLNLKQALLTKPLISSFSIELSCELQAEESALKSALEAHYSKEKSFFIARRILESDSVFGSKLSNYNFKKLAEIESDVMMADARYSAVHQIAHAVLSKTSDKKEHFTAKLDRIVLNRILAFPIFLSMMYLMFFLAINVGGAFQDFFDISSDAIFVQGGHSLLQAIHAPNWLIALLADGVGKGINTTITFIPVIASMFFLLSFLELSGYMARAAFVVDKLMRILGLPGKSFVPMIVGFGCNVPAIMAARTLDSERDRVLTVLMSPFMSCSARLAIYAVFVAAFFPIGGQNVVFSLYLIGIIIAVLTGFILRKTVLRGQTAPFIIELPAYHRPSILRMLKDTRLRLRYFIIRAGKLIIPICVLLGGLNAWMINISPDMHQVSILAFFGQKLTPIFSPMGISEHNWPAVVGLLTGMLAKEVVVGTLNSLYAQMGHVLAATNGQFDFILAMRDAVWSIPHNLLQLKSALSNPILASSTVENVSGSFNGLMYQQFDGKVGAYAYLLFILLYIPCVSTMAAIRQETNRKLMWFSITWSVFVAYMVAVLFYQISTYFKHPGHTILWVCGFGIVLFLLWKVYCIRSRLQGEKYAVATF